MKNNKRRFLEIMNKIYVHYAEITKYCTAVKICTDIYRYNIPYIRQIEMQMAGTMKENDVN